MEKITIEKFLERIKELPLDLRMGITNIDFLSAIRSIQRENQLHIDQGASLEDLTFRVILGDISDDEYIRNLQNDLSVGREMAYKLANEINDTVLEPIRTEIQNIQQENETIEAAATLPKDIPIEEDHSNLTPEDVLAGIENPHPSVAIKHETIIPSAPVPVVVKPPTQPATKVDDITIPTPVVAPAPEDKPIVEAPSLPKVPTVKLTDVLNKKLDQATSSKPVQVSHNIDPYKEPVE